MLGLGIWPVKGASPFHHEILAIPSGQWLWGRAAAAPVKVTWSIAALPPLPT